MLAYKDLRSSILSGHDLRSGPWHSLLYRLAIPLRQRYDHFVGVIHNMLHASTLVFWIEGSCDKRYEPSAPLFNVGSDGKHENWMFCYSAVI